MLRLPMFCGLGLLLLTLLVGTGATQDAKKDKEEKKDEKKIKGSVPIGWGKALKLSKDQIKKIHEIDVEYKTKIADLEKKIDGLKLASRIEMTKELTDDQKAILAKLAGLEGKDKEKDKVKDKDKNPDKDK